MNVLLLLQPFCECNLIILSNLYEFAQYFFIINELVKLFKFGSILLKSWSDQIFDKCCQFRIAFDKPAAESDSVCFVVEFFWVQFIKMIQLTIL